jgi:uncharacterized membrane protein
MSQETNDPKVAQSVPPVTPSVGAKEMEEGKTFAILSYVLSFVGLPFFVVPLITRNNAYSLYHAKQCLIIWLVAVVSAAVNVIPCLGQIVWVAVAVCMLVFNIMGLMNAIKGEMKPLPLIGKFGEEWFKGLTKV